MMTADRQRAVLECISTDLNLLESQKSGRTEIEDFCRKSGNIQRTETSV